LAQIYKEFLIIQRNRSIIFSLLSSFLRDGSVTPCGFRPEHKKNRRYCVLLGAKEPGAYYIFDHSYNNLKEPYRILLNTLYSLSAKAFRKKM